MSIGKAIMAKTEDEREMWGDIEVLRSACAHRIFCQSTGAVLDVKTAVIVTVVKGEARSAMIVVGDAYDRIRPDLDGLLQSGAITSIEVIDGRELDAKRKGYERAARQARAVAKATGAMPKA